MFADHTDGLRPSARRMGVWGHPQRRALAALLVFWTDGQIGQMLGGFGSRGRIWSKNTKLVSNLSICPL